MKLSLRKYSITVLCWGIFFWGNLGFGQNNGFRLTYNAKRLGDSCFQLTKDNTFLNGAIWSKTRIDLNQDFRIHAKLIFGTLTEGADGIGFVVQYLGSNLGSAGEGIGFGGISPSIGIEFDTYQNPYDPGYDHAALIKNGNSKHQSSPANTLQGPQIPLKTNGITVKDGKYYPVVIQWDASSKVLKCSFNGVEKINHTIDLQKDIFKDSQYVYWGFTAATGGQVNNHYVCIDSFFVSYEGDCQIAYKKQVSPFYICQPKSDTIQVNFFKIPNVYHKIRWSTGDTTQKIFKKIDYNNRKFKVTITNKFTVCNDSVVFNIINPQLYIDTLRNYECTTTNKKFVVPGSWNFILWNDNTTSANKVLTKPGQYWVEVTDKLYCKTRDTFEYILSPDTLKILETQAINPTCKSYTNGSALISKVNRPIGTTLSYYWTPTNQTTKEALNLKSGSYQCIVKDAKGCTDTVSIPILDPNAVSISLKNKKDINCNGLKDGNFEVFGNSGRLPYQFSILGNTKQNSGLFQSLQKGNYTAIVYDSNNCTDTLVTSINEPDSLKLSITGFQGDCFGDSKGKIIAVGLGGVKPYLWTPNPTNLSTIKVDTVTAEKFELLNLPSKMYTIKLTDKNGCTAQIDQFISPKENIQINIDTSVKFNIAEKTKLSVNINPSGKYKYLWSPEKIFGTQINDSTPIIKLYDRAYIGLTVTNENFCSKSVKFEIPVKIPPIYFWLPTAFTPDDNSLNDGYAPIGNFDWADFQIYNRWGQKIFHSSKDVQSWDGTFMGEPCQEGTYIVVARLKYDRFEQKRDARTSFTLLR